MILKAILHVQDFYSFGAMLLSRQTESVRDHKFHSGMPFIDG